MTYGKGTSTARVTSTNNNNIDALLNERKWKSPNVTFSFTSSFTNDYERGYNDSRTHRTSFEALNPTQRAATRSWANMYEDVSGLNLIELTGSNDRNATIRMAESRHPNTAYAYMPGSSVEAGDIWFRRVKYNNPKIGNYEYHTFGHELGHALGLEHGHEKGGVRGVAMDSNRDSMEFSIMTYRSYIGDDISGYNNEKWGYAQSLMMYDIAAIQQMYGANFNTNSGNTTYSFSTDTGQMFVNGVGQGVPGGNNIFRTIWDGNGIDTYNFSNYKTDLAIDLAPGGWTDLDVGGNEQRAKLGPEKYARGHVFNALQYRGDSRSLIENANGGSGNDKIEGNSANNVLRGNDGNDRLDGGGIGVSKNTGNDTLYGGNGNDTLDGDDGNDRLYGNSSVTGGGLSTETNTLIGDEGNDSLYGSDGNDRLRGGDDNDFLRGNGGNDSIDGGSGTDRASYYYATGSVSVNLTTGKASGADGNDTLTGIENLSGSAYGDRLTGNSIANVIDGHRGNDTINSRGGADTTDGGSGNDRIIDNDFVNSDHHNGGSGIDTIDYSYVAFSPNRVTIDLAKGKTTVSGGNTETISNFENVEGSQGSEKIIGNTSANRLDGNSGDDTIYGQGGSDTLIGGNGNDVLDSDTLATVDRLGDVLDGGAGNDILKGEAGNDRLIGGSGNDTLKGDDSVLNYGHDNLLGGSGSDTLVGGAGNDVLNGYGRTSGEYDVLTGDRSSSKPNVRNSGDGADRFILGDSSLAYYLGNGYAIIKDFFGSEGDRFQVKGSLSDYSFKLGNWSGSSASDTLIQYKNDTIAIVEDTTNVSTSQHFTFV